MRERRFTMKLFKTRADRLELEDVPPLRDAGGLQGTVVRVGIWGDPGAMILDVGEEGAQAIDVGYAYGRPPRSRLSRRYGKRAGVWRHPRYLSCTMPDANTPEAPIIFVGTVLRVWTNSTSDVSRLQLLDADEQPFYERAPGLAKWNKVTY